MARVLVTGATGFVGAALAARLRRDGHEVVGTGGSDGPIDDPSTLARFAGSGFAWAFHLAGRTFVPESWADPVGFCRVNALGTASVLEFCRAQSIGLTHVSAYVYGQPARLPVGEDAEPRPNNPYAWSKFLAEKLCEFYAAAHGMRIIVVRPFNVYGAGQDPRFLVPTLVRQVLDGEAIRVQDVRPRRDYVFIDDLVEALVLTQGRDERYAVYNIGSGGSLSVAEMIDVIQSVACTRKEVVSDGTRRAQEIDDVVADISLARARLAWQPRHTFEEGIRKMLQTEGRQA